MRVEKSTLLSDKPDKRGNIPAEIVSETMAPATSNTEIPDSTSDRRVPLKTILQNFLNHVESLEIRKKEGEDAYEKEFQSLKLFSDQLKCQADFSSSEGEKDVNRKKNRYKDILPFDYTRVALSEYPGVPGSDYINANFIKGASGSNAYIACQGPLPHTVNDFWRMVVECEVQVIVMACNEQEAGKHKCEKYWRDENDEITNENTGPTSNQPSVTFGKYDVTLLKSREICPDFLVRTMRLRWKNEGSHPESKNKSRSKRSDQNSDGLSVVSQSNAQGQVHNHEAIDEANSSEDSASSEEFDEERTVCQFHYSAWPDHGIPLHVKPLLEMVRLIRDCQASETLPVLIHCSAGCGRTGTICAIDFIWGLLRTGKLSEDFSLYSLVREMRKQRIAMVQTVDQYILVHRAVKELFLEQLKVIDAHPYENVDDDGHPISINRSSDCNDPIIPDYETIFVKGNENKIASSASSTTSVSNLSTAVDFDRILSQKMLQSQIQKRQQDDAYNCSERIPYGQNSEELPPNPPPKQRNMLDSKTIDSKNVTVPMPLSIHEETVIHHTKELNLFEPPSSKKTLENQNSLSCSAGSGTSGPQKFKKGNLRLTQTEDGAWKLHELESEVSEMKINDETNSQLQSSVHDQSKKEIKTNDSISILKKGKHKREKKTSPNKSVDDSDSPKAGELLRRPSIKKIRAFFNKEKPQIIPDSSKDTSPTTSTSSSTSGLNQGINPKEESNDVQNDNGDHDIAIAMAKLPKFEENRHQFVGQLSKMESMSNSKSVPSSLDRRACNAVAQNKASHDKNSVIRNNNMDVQFVRSQSSERIPTGFEVTAVPVTSTFHSFSSTQVLNSNTDRPQLPVKRSKSMRAGSMSPTTNLVPISTESGASLVNIDTQLSLAQLNAMPDSKNVVDAPNISKQLNDVKENRRKAPGTEAKLSCDKPSNNSIMNKTKQYFGLPLKHYRNDNENHFSFPTESTKTNPDYPSPPPKPKRWNNNSSSPEYANVAMSKLRCDNIEDQVSYDNSSKETSKSYSMTDFNHLKNQLVKMSDNTRGSNEGSLFLESNLMKLQARKESSDQGISAQDSKRTLKDCQDYLMASFDMAEKEGERLISKSQVSVDQNSSAVLKVSPERTLSSGKIRTNRSAESSPITTMQKKSVFQQREQLFSSHSSPSSSYNKYNALCSPSNNSASIEDSPPYVMRKSGSNSSFSGHRNYNSQISSNGFEKTDTRNLSKISLAPKANNAAMHNKSPIQADSNDTLFDKTDVSTSSKSLGNSYSVVALEAQRKVSAAVVAGGPKARERRNSFREAVESGAGTENKKEPLNSKKPPKKPYESIWFGKGGEECLEAESENVLPAYSSNQSNFVVDERKQTALNSMDSSSRPPIYVNTPMPLSKRQETTQRHYSNISYAPPESAVTSAHLSSSGYEPVTFHDGKAFPIKNAPPEERSCSNERITPPGGLQCVSLVNEIMNSSRSNSSNLVKPTNTSSLNLSPISRNKDSFTSQNEMNCNKKDLRKQNSSGSVVSISSGNSGNGNKGPPPPYKQPPKVISGSSTPQCKTAPTFPIDDRFSSSQGHSPRYQNIHMSAKSLSHRSPPPSDGSQSVIETGNKTGTYANISFLRHNPGMNIPTTEHQSENKTENTRQVPPSLKHPSSSTGDLLPGIDLDAVALMMQGGKEHLSTSMSSLGGYSGNKVGSGGNNRATVGRTIAGVFSGAAANIKSRFSNISSGNNIPNTNLPSQEKYPGIITTGSNDLITQHNGNLEAPFLNEYTFSRNEKFPNSTTSNSQNQYHPQNNHRWSENTLDHFTNNRSVEQLAPNDLPITVPGSDLHVSQESEMTTSNLSSSYYIPKSVNTFSQDVSQSPSHTFGYPQRPLARPQGPRNPPSHFQRKQEYL